MKFKACKDQPHFYALFCPIHTSYAVITDPLSAGATQVIVAYFEFVSYQVVGAAGTLGTVRITPSPEADSDEGPMAFVAATLARTQLPPTRKQGDDCRSEMANEQLKVGPVQLVTQVDVVPSLYRIYTLQSVIGEPPSFGAVQEIMTFVPEIAVVGAAGMFGIV